MKNKLRTLFYPLSINFWPLLLLVSQKALVPLGLILVNIGDNQYRRNLLVSTVMLIMGAVTLFFQQTNVNAWNHYLGFALFLLSLPLINYTIAQNREQLIRGLAILSLFNCVMAIVVYSISIDLSIYRGLNRIVNIYGITDRVYYETTSLLIIISLQFIHNKVFRWISYGIVGLYLIFIAKSLFVILLFLINKFLYVLKQGSVLKRLGIFIFIVLLGIIAPTIISVIRADAVDSLNWKLLQFTEILNDTSAPIIGSGWGYTIDGIVKTATQDYQVEMQLPMLVRQIGFLGVFIYLTGIFILIRSISVNLGISILRWAMYVAIGFNNPWLFLPSWYMTACLMFNEFDHKKI